MQPSRLIRVPQRTPEKPWGEVPNETVSLFAASQLTSSFPDILSSFGVHRSFNQTHTCFIHSE